MQIIRKSYQYLIDWKSSSNRKPLLIRGARQVGKTTLVRQFAVEFSNFVELNMEKEADRNIFERTDDTIKILDTIFLLNNVPQNNQPTLIFIDEIQDSPKAIHQLRYLYEEHPELFIIAAGSLLEFSLNKVPNFPVGRIDYLFLHPLNFDEFLGTVQNDKVLKVLNEIPVPDYAHEIILNLFHDYAIIGGMPEIVSHYAENKNIAALSGIYQQLWQSYKDDVEKYAKNNSERNIIRHIIETAPNEADRIKFEGFGNSNYRSREVGEAMRTLDLSRIIQLIYPSTSLTPPVIANYKKRPRLQFLDTGLLNQILAIQGELISLNDINTFYKGRIIQHLVGQQLISQNDQMSYKPYFWVREEKNASSEIDFIYQFQNYIIPIEIKSGKQGKLRSLHQFIERTNHPYAIRMLANTFSIERVKTPAGKPYILMNLPYYLGTKIPQYIEYLLDRYELISEKR